ncbi:DUF4376 domain-containing protein [Acinetobacter baumannii]|uniref:DUF4376 domain-containing protein n=2 Tax=Acinetobacter baumannii TaxID=470 RepID=A0A241ZCT4_ACIBA|nr:DUF4376 domain-containing protein [Acinetobacter baumannii]EKU2731500.1 DUF4376 domain-containing protein [Acinetobacter baumannii]EKU6136086.1 DUF4376 domain-containing protein [Acinetobacter baumannii]EKU9772808.1 DUF4376 domain-containing protein [Acinetobacter baumannii]EKV0044972.1 DUF4376 domain-containing protein [Acinetobacter baumannii]EKW4168271.1 DUF4376 domain-containing protein [Acinetobacter baumannii]
MTAIVEKTTGRLIKTISAPDDVIKLNTPDNCYATDDPPDRGMMYLDGEWVYIPPSPGQGYKFDYSVRQWIDTRSLEEVKAQQWEVIKAERNQYEFGGFEFENKLYDSDPNSQLRIATAALLGVSVEWTLKDNSVVNLSPDQLIDLKTALAVHINNIHERGRIARQKIETALTYEEIEAVNF